MINWDHVQELHHQLGPFDFATVVEQLIDEMNSVTGRLHTPDPLTLEIDVHRLKACATTLGFDDLSAKCREVQRQLDLHHDLLTRDSVTPKTVSALLNCCDRSVTIFDGEVSGRLAA